MPDPRREPLGVLRLVTRGTPSLDVLLREFPTVTVTRAPEPERGDVVIDAEAWSSSETFRPFDDAVFARAGGALAVVGAAPVRAACESLTRYQRALDRRNAASRGALFDAVLAAHRGLHDLDKPLVRADWDHALDAWQWMLRLDPAASLAAQLAALFHDVERLETEADRRVEHRAPDYQAFKDAHASRGADRAYAVLRDVGVDAPTAARVRAIVAAHERRRGDPEIDLLNDADALSFFSLNSAGYADYFGAPQTRRKIAWTLRRLGPTSRDKLRLVRLRPDVARLTEEAAA